MEGLREPMLQHLAEAGISMAYLERALRLPARTVARWKSGNVSASGLALLRVVRRFPWVVEVAASRFAEDVAARAVVGAAAETLHQAAEGAGYRYGVSAASLDDATVELTARFTRAPLQVGAAADTRDLVGAA